MKTFEIAIFGECFERGESSGNLINTGRGQAFCLFQIDEILTLDPLVIGMVLTHGFSALVASDHLKGDERYPLGVCLPVWLLRPQSPSEPPVVHFLCVQNSRGSFCQRKNSTLSKNGGNAKAALPHIATYAIHAIFGALDGVTPLRSATPTGRLSCSISAPLPCISGPSRVTLIPSTRRWTRRPRLTEPPSGRPSAICFLPLPVPILAVVLRACAGLSEVRIRRKRNQAGALPSKDVSLKFPGLPPSSATISLVCSPSRGEGRPRASSASDMMIGVRKPGTPSLSISIWRA